MMFRARSLVVGGALLLLIGACAGSSGTSDPSFPTEPAASSDSPADTPPILSTAAATSPDATVATETASVQSSTVAPPTSVFSIDCGLQAGPFTIDEREFELYLPDQVGSADNPTGLQSPLLVLLHGFAGNGVEFAATTGLDQLAPTAGVVLAAPQGIGEVPTWHIGSPDDPLVASDIEFLGALIDELTAGPCINPDNVWLAGFSAGSAYTGVYGCSEVDRFRGLAMVSGLPPALCSADANTSIQITHGTDDSIVAFEGGEQTVSDDGSVELDGVSASAANWAEVAGCGDPDRLVLGETHPSSVTAWRSCAGQAEVSLLAVTGLNHVWAGGASPEFLEPVTPIVNAGCVILHAMTDSDGDRFESCFG